MAGQLLQEGDVFHIAPDDGWRIYTKGLKGPYLEVKGRQSHFAGDYIVTRTQMDGGGVGHGGHDAYENGHHVFAYSPEKDIKIDFYQSGYFVTLREKPIEVIGKAECHWVIVKRGT